jgi:hypothetical protein
MSEVASDRLQASVVKAYFPNHSGERRTLLRVAMESAVE